MNMSIVKSHEVRATARPHIGLRLCHICSTVALALFTSLSSYVALGATVAADEYATLLTEANTNGVVPVTITLEKLTLADLSAVDAAKRAALNAKAKALLAELGSGALEGGYWKSDMGQIGVYVTPAGVRALAQTRLAETFMPDHSRKMRFRAHDLDGSLDAIDATINAGGNADVEVFLNVDAGDYDIGRDGQSHFRSSQALSDDIGKRLSNILSQGYARGFKNLDTGPTRATQLSPSVRVTVDRNAFYALRESPDVRALRPVGYVDPRPARWPEEALTAAKEKGSVEILIALRGGSLYSPKTGYMSVSALMSRCTIINQGKPR